MVRPIRSSSRKTPQVPQWGTRFALAMRTRGASGVVRKMPTGLPDCTRRVSSFSSSRSAATIASKASQLRAARPVPP